MYRVATAPRGRGADVVVGAEVGRLDVQRIANTTDPQVEDERAVWLSASEGPSAISIPDQNNQHFRPNPTWPSEKWHIESMLIRRRNRKLIDFGDKLPSSRRRNVIDLGHCWLCDHLFLIWGHLLTANC